ncbi:hypothetical protein [Clostridium sp. HCS.1]|uniref:hypothetical protein n=1 Tax=Clostridium sp. HCS.1 TaxID=3238594 RepID=UPI003A0FC87D
MDNNDQNNFKMLTKAFERLICIILTFVLFFFIVMQKPEILTSVIEKLTELIRVSGFSLDSIITTIILSKLI